MPIEIVPMYPKIEGIPILKDGHHIGKARIEANGEMTITFTENVTRDIVTMLRERLVDGFSIWPNVVAAEPMYPERSDANP